MAFYNDLFFPEDISFESPGGAVFVTSVVQTQSGFEQRNVERDVPLAEWDVGYGARAIDRVEALYKLFLAVRGKAHGFLYKDPLDYKSCDLMRGISRTDQLLGTATAGQTAFQLVKTVQVGATATMTKNIYKPKNGTVRVDKDGVNDTNNWTVNNATGIITHAPLTGGEIIKAGFEYYFPVRFDLDAWPGSFRAWQVGTVQVRVMETRAIV